MNERWLPVVGYEGLYSVSDLGRVRSEARMVRHSTGGGFKRINARVMRVMNDGNGYPKVSLCRAGTVRNARPHQLVARAFLGECPDGMEVAHNDGVRSNVALTNLRYDTRLGNHADRRRHGTLGQGSSNGCAKLTEAEALEVRNSPALLRELSDRFGISQTTASRIRLGRNWKHLPAQTMRPDGVNPHVGG